MTPLQEKTSGKWEKVILVQKVVQVKEVAEDSHHWHHSSGEVSLTPCE